MLAGMKILLPLIANAAALWLCAAAVRAHGGSSPGRFALCQNGYARNCVVDGDTFALNGMRVRIADIDAPETHPPRCAREAALGRQATMRLQMLLNIGAFRLASIDRDTDRYGRKLRLVERDGRSIGQMLVAEGLARRYRGGHRTGWCKRDFVG